MDENGNERIMKITLEMAFRFDCLKCGIENFVHPIVVEHSAEERKKIKQDDGVVCIPTEVRCGACGAEFEVDRGD
jgi:transcription elongation factor Elf1